MAFSKLLLLASACLAAGASDFSNLVSSVEAELNDLNSQVEAWTAVRGLVGALRIQNSVQPLVSNVNNLKTAAQNVSPADVSPAQLQSLTNSIVAVLQSLAAKEGDFALTGARQIVANDIRDLETPTADIISALVNSLKQDCGKLESLSPLIPQISNAFSNADKAYGGQPVQFPSAPACQRRAVYEGAEAAQATTSFATSRPILNPPLSIVSTPPSPSKGVFTETKTIYECPPSSTLNAGPVAVNLTTSASAGRNTSGAGASTPELVGSIPGFDQNNTLLVPVLSNGAASSMKIGAAAVGIVVIAGLL